MKSKITVRCQFLHKFYKYLDLSKITEIIKCLDRFCKENCLSLNNLYKHNDQSHRKRMAMWPVFELNVNEKMQIRDFGNRDGSSMIGRVIQRVCDTFPFQLCFPYWRLLKAFLYPPITVGSLVQGLWCLIDDQYVVRIRLNFFVI